MEQLICRDLCLGYDGREILHRLSFAVHAGDYLCIVGENGSGKTTLMKAILGLQAPLSGRIETQNGLSSRGIGYLPQQTAVQKDFPATVSEIVLSGCQGQCGLRPFYSRAQKALAKRNLERMGIAQLSGRCYRELSGGQQQRVLLARALCATQRMLFLDEPVTGLDPAAAEELYALIASLHKEGITVLMITHDIAAVKAYATHVLHLGNTVFFGTKEAYFAAGPASGKEDSHGNP